MLGGPNLDLRLTFRSSNMNFEAWGLSSPTDQSDSVQFNVFFVDIKEVGSSMLG